MPDQTLPTIGFDPETPPSVIHVAAAMMQDFIAQHVPFDTEADRLLAMEDLRQRFAALDVSGVRLLPWYLAGPDGPGT